MESIKKNITLKGQEIAYTVNRSLRARQMRITIYGDGEVVVTLPKRMPVFAVIPFLHFKADWIMEHLTKIRRHPVPRHKKLTKKDYEEHKESALRLAKDRVAFFADLYGFSYRSVSVRDQKSRWGSCSRKGNLHFNYRIVLMPEDVRDYIIVHEICHLKEFNHSTRFWNLVEKTIPNHKVLRKSLRTDGMLLG